MTLIIGHRGAKATYAENTLTSFEKAIRHGADGIELDIHYSKDGEIMVFHDFTLDRMCKAEGAIYELPMKELQALTVHFKGQKEKIPTLREVLEMLLRLQTELGRKLLLNVELKAGSDFYPGIEEKALKLCLDYLPHDQLIFSSFDHPALQRIKALDPAAQIGALTSCAMVNPWEYLERLKADYYHPAYQSLVPRNLEGLLMHHVRLNPYTVNDVSTAEAFIKNGLNALITDVPDVMVALREKVSQAPSDAKDRL